MAKTEKLPLVAPKTRTFYLIDGEGKLEKRSKKIYSPFNKSIFNPREPKFDTFHDPKFVLFEDGTFETDDNELIDTCLAYNNAGLKINLNKYSGGEESWKLIKGDFTHNVVEDKPKDNKVETIETRVEVEVQKIPRIIAEGMTVEQLKTLCETWEVAIGEAKTRDELVKALAETNKLS